MPIFSKRSINSLNNCDPLLKQLANEAIKHIDFTVIEGQRSLEDQRKAVQGGFSQTMHSKHTTSPARAFDFIPYPFVDADWKKPEKFWRIAKVIKKVAWEMGILVRCGIDWNMNESYTDESFVDLGHVELLTLQEFRKIRRNYLLKHPIVIHPDIEDTPLDMGSKIIIKEQLAIMEQALHKTKNIINEEA